MKEFTRLSYCVHSGWSVIHSLVTTSGITFFFCFILSVLTILLNGSPAVCETLFNTESKYQILYVTKEGNIIYLRNGSLANRSSAMDLNDPYRHVFEYTGIMMLGLGYVDSPKDVLMIGLGGGTVPKYIRKYYKDMKITNVDFDEKIPEIANKYFNLKPDARMKTISEDGRRFIMKSKKKWDIIFLDAYRGGYIPFHLLTKEFFIIIRDHLKNQGVVVSNTFKSSKLYNSESATYADVFGGFDSYRGYRAGNRIIIARKDGEKIDFDVLEKMMSQTQDQIRFKEINLVEMLHVHYDHDCSWPRETKILTDDFAPVNFLVDQP